MTSSFANLLPLLDESEQVPGDSPVLVLLRNIETAPAGGGPHAQAFLNTAMALHELGYHRTGLTYFALGTRAPNADCLILERDGFSRETHDILCAAQERPANAQESIVIAHNPKEGTWFTVGNDLRNPGCRVLWARAGSNPTSAGTAVYREENSPSQSGVLDAVDRWFDLPYGELLNVAERAQQKPLRSIAEAPANGQLDMFAGQGELGF